MEQIFTATKDFGLWEYFKKTDDVRIQLRDLFSRSKELIARERHINLEIVLLIAALERSNAAVNLNMLGGKRELAQKLGLTFDQFLKRAQAGRVLWRHPDSIGLIREGKTYVSHVGMLATKITDKNKELFLREIVGKSEREIRELVAAVNKDGSRDNGELHFTLKLTFTKAQLDALERAREVLSARGCPPSDEETVAMALTDLLEKRDPIKRATRAIQRAEKKLAHAAKQDFDEILGGEATEGSAGLDQRSQGAHALKQQGLGQMDFSTSIVTANTCASKHSGRKVVPAAVKHEVTLRDDCCSFLLADGRRCGSAVGVQYDHIIPVAHGGCSEVQNIRLLCREHNLMEAIRKLGPGTMGKYLL